MIDYDTALELLEERLKIENKEKKEVRDTILLYFGKVASLIFPCSIPAGVFKIDLHPKKEEINALLAEMRKAIYLILLSYSKKLLAIKQKFFEMELDVNVDEMFTTGDDNIHDKCFIYSRRLSKEFESWFAMALLYKWSKDTLISNFKSNIQTPYNNQFFNTAIRKSTFSATRLKYGGVSYGVGQYKSALNSLSRLSVIAIGAISKLADLSAMRNDGVSAISVHRGSTYPCQLCDDKVGIHPLLDEFMPPFHANCKCFAVPLAL